MQLLLPLISISQKRTGQKMQFQMWIFLILFLKMNRPFQSHRYLNRSICYFNANKVGLFTVLGCFQLELTLKQSKSCENLEQPAKSPLSPSVTPAQDGSSTASLISNTSISKEERSALEAAAAFHKSHLTVKLMRAPRARVKQNFKSLMKFLFSLRFSFFLSRPSYSLDLSFLNLIFSHVWNSISRQSTDVLFPKV